MIELTYAPLDVPAVLNAVQDSRAGAVVLFLGTVRELTGEVVTKSLDYEAYESMARTQLSRLIETAKGRWGLSGVAVAHRLGTLAVSEISVAVAVSSPHRVEAFAAAEWLMNTIKSDVPIWKREDDGAGQKHWVHPVTLPLATSSPSASSSTTEGA